MFLVFQSPWGVRVPILDSWVRDPFGVEFWQFYDTMLRLLCYTGTVPYTLQCLLVHVLDKKRHFYNVANKQPFISRLSTGYG